MISLKNLIKKRDLKVGVVGLGYVGMPTVIALTKFGVQVIGFDINQKKIDELNKGKSFIAEISDQEIQASKKLFRATSNWDEIKKCNIILITVPTPITKNKTPDTRAIENASEEIAKRLKPETLIILESTTYPGTTDELIKPILETSGLKAGKDFYLAFAPERIDPGNKQYQFHEIPKIVGGINKKSKEIAVDFYRIFINKVYPVSSTKTAEMTKLLENIFRLVNISMINELKMLSDKMGINIWEVIEAASTKPYGFTPFYPGPGVGGHCIPVDPFYFSWKAKEFNFFSRFIELAGEINELMPHHIVTKIIWALNKKNKSIRDSKILVLGVAFKKNIDDARESPALKIIWDLLRKGAKINYNDPYIPTINIKNKKLISKNLTPLLINQADCVVILTDHSKYDYSFIHKNAKLIIDTRNATKKHSSKIIL